MEGLDGTQSEDNCLVSCFLAGGNNVYIGITLVGGGGKLKIPEEDKRRTSPLFEQQVMNKGPQIVTWATAAPQIEHCFL